jgi:hypothetical protein
MGNGIERLFIYISVICLILFGCVGGVAATSQTDGLEGGNDTADVTILGNESVGFDDDVIDATVLSKKHAESDDDVLDINALSKGADGNDIVSVSLLSNGHVIEVCLFGVGVNRFGIVDCGDDGNNDGGSGDDGSGDGGSGDDGSGDGGSGDDGSGDGGSGDDGGSSRLSIVDWWTEPTDVHPGDTVSAGATVRSYGAGAQRTTIELIRDGETVETRRGFVRDTRNFTFEYSFESPGEYRLGIGSGGSKRIRVTPRSTPTSTPTATAEQTVTPEPTPEPTPSPTAAPTEEGSGLDGGQLILVAMAVSGVMAIGGLRLWRNEPKP